LAKSLDAVALVADQNPEDSLADAVLLAYELIRLDLLHTRNQHPELNGLPMNGSDQDKETSYVDDEQQQAGVQHANPADTGRRYKGAEFRPAAVHRRRRHRVEQAFFAMIQAV